MTDEEIDEITHRIVNEIDQQIVEGIEFAANYLGMTFEEMVDLLKEHYEGKTTPEN